MIINTNKKKETIFLYPKALMKIEVFRKLKMKPRPFQLNETTKKLFIK